uniref:Uncharacterized protein n=1 Tax=Chromera velia CCMP2878 TaxID=1169474 RepID=A0A0G4G9S9_9ALVE|eukprot:Cvel_20916.t1-p1 / transcript=Cvel_20916.t1 / gene=Cvel_20916 / organism=Chromera_velia_CCMP2878 / gene_product=hypothetical protein / transcript_product=hypothetical protein / location=Cvel_scaffold1919:12787-13173(-) / protein_length=129 / sequence_SO=supercontig / SO=protein_coding / is_pseudo=false
MPQSEPTSRLPDTVVAEEGSVSPGDSCRGNREDQDVSEATGTPQVTVPPPSSSGDESTASEDVRVDADTGAGVGENAEVSDGRDVNRVPTEEGTRAPEDLSDDAAPPHLPSGNRNENPTEEEQMEEGTL